MHSLKAEPEGLGTGRITALSVDVSAQLVHQADHLAQGWRQTWRGAPVSHFPANPALDSYDYVHDVTTQMRAFANLKAGLEFYGSPPNQQIRLALRIYFVVLCGLQADYNFYPPITWNEGGIDLIACQKTIEVSGQGPCRRATPTGDIASLPCCYCWCTQAGNLCWVFRFGLNALHCYGAYAVCVPSSPR